MRLHQAPGFERPRVCVYISLMASHAQARRDHKATRTAKQAVVGATEAGTSVAAGKNEWRPIPGTRFYCRNGEGIYDRLTDLLFLRVDDVDENDVGEIIERYRAAFAVGDAAPGPADEAPTEQEALEILDRLDRRLSVQEALTAQLMQRYGLAV
jgi:hypothetical protein